jgi:16S rRNA (cytosine967-C5)-methyltransferase
LVERRAPEERRTPRRVKVDRARRLALDTLSRIDRSQAYANLQLPATLGRSNLPERDRAFVTELVYGTIRMRRACDWLVDRFVQRELDIHTRDVLRMGAYQLHYLGTPAYAVVSTSVELAGRASRLVEAVLRRVAENEPAWPDDATRLSYPDWIFDRLVQDLGRDDAVAAMETMNKAPTVHERPDGYVQDLASQWTAAYVGAQAGEVVADLCAAPGGKATAMAETGAFVAAGDVRPNRATLVRDNAARVGTTNVGTFVADGRRPPMRAADRVLVDAPCSGLGVLRRRPDARWRISPTAVDELVVLQEQLLSAAADLVRPGGTLVYSVCTLTDAETSGMDAWLASTHPELAPESPPGEPWRPFGRGARLLPQTADTDGMYVLGLRRNG